jgi:hypothetical protein
VSELITTGGFCVRHLAQEFRRDRTIKDEIAVEQLDLLDSLPASNRSGTRRWARLIFEFLLIRVRPKGVIMLQHGSTRVFIKRGTAFRMLAEVIVILVMIRLSLRRMRHILARKVGVMVSIGVECVVFTTIGMGGVCVRILVARVWDILDGVLKSWLEISAVPVKLQHARSHDRYQNPLTVG